MASTSQTQEQNTTVELVDQVSTDTIEHTFSTLFAHFSLPQGIERTSCLLTPNSLLIALVSMVDGIKNCV